MGRLSEHFATGSTLTGQASSRNLAEVRTALAQLKTVADSADVKGCASTVVVGVEELKAGIADLQKSVGDGQVLMHGLFSLFDAGDKSPLAQKANAARSRIDGAVKVLKEAGVTGLEWAVTTPR